jgi:hypothetical protein
MWGKVDMYRKAFNINKAYDKAFSQTQLKPDEMIIVEYPRGMGKIFANGQKRYMLCAMNLYGHPVANRSFYLERDKWIMEHFNNKVLIPGWTVKQMQRDTVWMDLGGRAVPTLWCVRCWFWAKKPNFAI